MTANTAREVGVNTEMAIRENTEGRDPGWRPAGGGSLRYVTAVTLVAAYSLVVLGDTVRVTESGMGCSSWPLCNGSAWLTGGYHALLEQSHRYLAAIVTTLVLAVFVLVWRRARGNRLAWRSAIASVALIGVQVTLGALTVFAHNAGWTVALHLAGAWLVVASVTVTTIAVWRNRPNPAAADDSPCEGPLSGVSLNPSGRLGLVAATALFLVSVAGMLVLHGNASTACPGWPTCGTGTGPVSAVVLQYLHRTLVGLATVALMAAAIRAWRSAAADRADRTLAASSLILLAATAAMGAIVALSGAANLPQDLHLAVATLLWISVVALATPHTRAPRRDLQRVVAQAEVGTYDG